MFTKTLDFFFLTAMAILAAAAPGSDFPSNTITVTAIAPSATTISQCNTGDAQCCSTVGAAKDLPAAGAILGLLGIVLQDVTATVGLDCIPINVIGLDQGANCAMQPVCCSNNNFNGLINLGCNPISL